MPDGLGELPMLRGRGFGEVHFALANLVAELFFLGLKFDQQLVFEQLHLLEQQIQLGVHAGNLVPKPGIDSFISCPATVQKKREASAVRQLRLP